MAAELLSQVSERICQAKSWDETARDKPFGGVNVIFASDFGQLCPPKFNALYSYKLVKSLAPVTMQTIKGQTALHGAFLWRQVDTVIELKQNWRAKDDAPFVDMLNRIWMGKARRVTPSSEQPSDYDILKTRLLSELKQNSPQEFHAFNDAPIVVTKKFCEMLLMSQKLGHSRKIHDSNMKCIMQEIKLLAKMSHLINKNKCGKYKAHVLMMHLVSYH
jgi:hypothetical protein